jgi:hypothetical protein
MNASGSGAHAGRAGRETVIALFHSQADAEQAIQDLKDAGFPRDAIGVVLRDPSYGHGPLPATGPVLPGETATAGALGGGILGGVVGLLAGVGALALPGVGPVIAGGVLVPSLTGAGVGAAAGGVLGALIGLGIPDSAARYFEEGVRQGSVLVMVDAGARREAARDILRFSRGDLGAAASVEEADGSDLSSDDEAWRGNERRYRHDPAYHGPERRLSHH